MADKSDVKDLDDQLLAQMFQDFLEEAPDHLDQLNLNLIQLEGNLEEGGVIDEIFRIVHTLKGSAAFVGLQEISGVSAKMQDMLGDARKGTIKITAATVDVMYEALDVLVSLVDKARGKDTPEVDVSQISQKLESIIEGPATEPEKESDGEETAPLGPEELLSIYKGSYDQLAALKHIVYSSVHLSEPKSLAVLFSKQIEERMNAQGNAVWLVADGSKVVEVARNGELVKEDKAPSLEIESSEILRRIIRDQLVIWSSSSPGVKEILPGFQKPVLFPIKAHSEALGFLVVDPEEVAEVEVYQFIGQFAAMILNISKLHQKVEEQREELNEMTEILFKQNAQLASIYHVEVDLMKALDPEDLCRIVVEAIVGELEARRAAVFLIDESSGELMGISERGGLQGIESMRFAIEAQKLIRKSLESGRVITYRDHPEGLRLGPNLLENWAILSFKGRDRPWGVLIAEFEDQDIGDAISILVNHASILLDCMMLQRRIGNNTTKR
ncbi:MAG: Hpt domain-containing protein [Thermodesulfobacteriota bacterium]|nr:Hpt domain-containing protein [Thermodesulfobacteriota bacterium]